MPSPSIQRALISVSDKTGLVDFARQLAAAGVEIYSTGGTARHLAEAQIEVKEISQYTHFPEMMDGRLKTLHPKVHGGILCRRDQAQDMDAAGEHGIVPFELVVVNLYPFEQTIARPGVTIDEAIEQIDIGGPTMVRAAAKNHAFVTLATDPSQYAPVAEQILAQGSTSALLRRQLAGAAFARTAAYDTAIATYFAALPELAGEPAGEDEAGEHRFEPQIKLQFQRRTTLRYGENPHQAAALYVPTGQVPAPYVSEPAGLHTLAQAEQLHGKELSYNNLLDLDAALASVRSLPRPGVVVLKHNNPCGAATAPSLAAAAGKAWDGDPVSAFGSVLGVNVPVDGPMAQFLAEPGKFVEAIVAPDFDADAIEILTTKPKWKKNVRLLRVGEVAPGRGAPGLAADRRWPPLPAGRRLARRPVGLERSDPGRSDHGDASRFGFCLVDLPACEVQCDRAGPGPRARRRGRGADEPRRFGGNRHPQSGGPQPRGRAGLRRFFPFCRFHRAGGRGRGRRGDPAGRIAPRRGSDRRLQRAWPADDLHRPPAFPALEIEL